MANSSSKFVVVAEDEWKLQCDGEYAWGKFSAKIGGIEFECRVDEGLLEFTCKDIRNGYIDHVALELNMMTRYHNDENYQQTSLFSSPRFLEFNKQNNYRTWSDRGIQTYVDRLLVIRILKERNLFPDFTLDKPIDRFKADKKLRVGQQIFHVNKQLLSMLSPYFDGLFNGAYVEAQQDVIDTGETDPALYHDFLVALTAPNLCGVDVLPTRKNIAGMMRLAKYYQADRLLQHCEHHLRICREIPAEERMLLAKKYGSKKLQDSLLYDVVTEDELRRVVQKIMAEG